VQISREAPVSNEPQRLHDPDGDDSSRREVHWIPLVSAVAIAIVGIGGLAALEAL
jgi:hypothetical protein